MRDVNTKRDKHCICIILFVEGKRANLLIVFGFVVMTALMATENGWE